MVLGTTMLSGYLLLAAHAVLPFELRLRHWVLLMIGCLLLSNLWSGRLLHSRRTGTLIRVSFLTWSSLVTLISADTVYALYFNTRVVPQLEEAANRREPLVSSFELHAALPRVQEGSSLFYKPDVSVESAIYGDLCTAADLRSPTIRNEVIEIRRFDIQVDEFGFRRSIPLDQARAILIGDSFAFGSGIESSRIFCTLLNEAGLRCYNGGYHGCGLVAQSHHLRWLLDRESVPGKLDWIVWTVYEGNDLYDSIDPTLPVDTSSIFDGSLVGGGVKLLETVRDESVISRALAGKFYILNASPHRTLDGVHLRGAVYESEKFGLKLFHPTTIDRAQDTAGAVENHPNMPNIRRSFADMRELADRVSAQIVVVLIPSAARVHGDQFTDFPQLEPPHFLNAIRDLAESHGCEVVDLLPPMKAAAERELVFFRDETHLNAAGHRITAEQILQVTDRPPVPVTQPEPRSTPEH